MEFWNKDRHIKTFKNLLGLQGAPDVVVLEALYQRKECRDSGIVTQLTQESNWYANNSPYYNVYPSIAECFSKVKLDIDGKAMTMPMDTILIRFAKGHEFKGIRSIFVYKFLWDKNRGDGIGTEVTYSDSLDDNDTILALFKSGETVEESISKHGILGGGVANRPENEQEVIRIVLALCLLAKDDSIVTADLLSKDRDRLAGKDITDDELQAAIDRAHRRGKVGWNVGKDIEINPHFRKPHFALRWTGKGREVPQIVPVKGAIVKRSSVTKVPTGYLGKEA